MEVFRRELLVARICSGSVRLKLDRARPYFVRRPSRDQVYLAQEVYAEQLYAAELEGLFNDQDLYEYLLENDLWDEKNQEFLQKLPKEVEEFKLKLFKANFRSNERKVVRKALQVAKDKLCEVEARRHAYDHLSCSGAASLARTRFLLGCSLCQSDGQRVFADDTFWEESCDLLDAALAAYAQVRLDEPTYRELARSEPWRSLWSCRKAEGSVFGLPLADYTDEQRSLTAFSTLYDSVYEHPDCPADEVIEDDDMLDGFLIDQRRQREASKGKRSAEDLIKNEKIRGASEVYLVADTGDDAAKVMDLNDEHSRVVQKQRFAYLRTKGEVHEADMPDTRQRLRMELTQKIMGAGK